jgi:hypothetical protein
MICRLRFCLFVCFVIHRVLDEVNRFHGKGERVPQLENRVKELKDLIRDIVHNDEVNPKSEWTIKAHELLEE